MDLHLDPAVAESYKSAPQRARRLTEDWATRNLYCVACQSDQLCPAPTNEPVFDFVCPVCSNKYQLKGKSGAFGGAVANSEYNRKLEAIKKGEAPNYAFVQYSTVLAQVTDLFVIPGHFFTPAVIQARNKLTEKARRAGWMGSTILLRALPAEARVQVITSGIAHDAAQVRRHWGRFAFLKQDKRAKGGWGAAVLSAVRTFQNETKNNEFSLQDFYRRFTQDLAAQFPGNNNVQPKIRQQLQVLRENKVIDFLGRGQYRVVA